MKKPILPILLACGTLSLSAQSSGFGIGILVGEPTGLSAKAWTGEGQAFAFGLAYGGWGYGGWGYGGWGHGGHFHAHADYLLHNFSLTNVSKGRMALHYGPGVRVRPGRATATGTVAVGTTAGAAMPAWASGSRWA